jgi:hypothetical protein
MDKKVVKPAEIDFDKMRKKVDKLIKTHSINSPI